MRIEVYNGILAFVFMSTQSNGRRSRKDLLAVELVATLLSGLCYQLRRRIFVVQHQHCH